MPGPWLAQVEARFGPDGRVSLGELVDQAGPRAFGFALIALALPGIVPGLSVVAGPLVGLGCAALGFQMLQARPAPWLPRRLWEFRVARSSVSPWLIRIEGLLAKWCRRTRPAPQPPAAWIALGALWAGVVLASPLGIIPFCNIAPALSACLLGIHLIEGDAAIGWAGLILLATFTLFAIGLTAAYWHLLFEPVFRWIQGPGPALLVLT